MDTEILMAMIESGKSKRVKRKLVQDQLTLAEALKYARGLEGADQHAKKIGEPNNNGRRRQTRSG